MRRLLLPALACAALAAQAEIRVRDDAGATVTLRAPARRVVSLAPHVTEMLFAAGGGSRIVGAVAYSDFPPQASRLPRVGDNNQVDIERLLALKPDLLVVWRHNAAARQMDRLRALGIPLYYSDPHTLQDIPRTLRQLGLLMGTPAEPAAAALERRIAALSAGYENRSKVRVFYQVWGSPLYTLNHRHIVNDAIRVCGGENIFAGLTPAAPMLAAEAVLQADPEVIVSGDGPGQDPPGAAMWKAWPAMLAVARGNLFAVDADLVNRAGPRILDGAARLCEYLELARTRRPETR